MDDSIANVALSVSLLINFSFGSYVLNNWCTALNCTVNCCSYIRFIQTDDKKLVFYNKEVVRINQ